MNNKYNIKDSQREIVKLIIKEPGLSRIQLARRTNLNKSTLSYITKDLENKNLIEFKKEKNSKGRFGSYIYFNYSYEKILFIEYGKRKIKSFICYLDGRILDSYVINLTDSLKKREEILQDHIENIKKSYPSIENCVFAIHGTVNSKLKELKSPFYTANYSTIESIFNNSNIDVTFENESNIYSFGIINKNSNDVIIDIQIKDGIGGSIILNGELFKGHNGLAGEIGHTIAQVGGKACNCGNLGCLEVYASDENTIAECRQKTLHSITKTSLLDYYISEPIVSDIVNRNITMLGKCLNDLCVVFNPNIINITSEIYYNIPNIENKLHEKLTSTALTQPNIVVRNYNIEVLVAGFAKLYMSMIV